MKALFLFSLLLGGFSHHSRAHTQNPDIRWSEGEHLELGEQAALRACSELHLLGKDCPVNARIPRGDGKISFHYGELVTSADYYHNPKEMFDDRRKGIGKVIACAHKQKRVHQDQDRSNEVDYPSCNIPGIIAMPNYLEIVTTNYDHFGWNNMKAYVKYHTLALNKAREAYEHRHSPQHSKSLLNKALIYNAYADHYLTDAFASGHNRVPRIQIKNWASRNLSGFYKSFRGDLLTWLLHDRESLSLHTNKEEGLLVENSLGITWKTRGDSHLHQADTPVDPARELPTQAITHSLKEVLVTWQTGVIPEGVFAATLYVPFHRGIPMSQKFSPAHQGMSKRQFYKAFYSDVPFVERLLYRKADLEDLLRALPAIFVQFRKDIRRDIETMSELSLRLPPEYLKAYSQVH